MFVNAFGNLFVDMSQKFIHEIPFCVWFCVPLRTQCANSKQVCEKVITVITECQQKKKIFHARCSLLVIPHTIFIAILYVCGVCVCNFLDIFNVRRMR